MERLKLAQALRLSGTETVAFVGAGGKTTAMFQLARELLPPVVVTTTTHLGAWQVELADRHFIVTTDEDLNAIEDNRRGVMLVTGPQDGDRFGGPGAGSTDWLHAMCGYHSLPLLVEADGARQKPLKAPAEHEPAVPEFADTVVVVAGLSGLGKPLSDEWVHRAERFGRVSGSKSQRVNESANQQSVTAERLAKALAHPESGLKGIPAGARRVALLNQADTPELQAQGKALAEKLLGAFEAVIVSSLKSQTIHAVHERIAGIVLAAGGASRFGRPKQLLDWRGRPFVRVVAQTALAAGLSPVVVVTGAYAEEVEAAVIDLPVQIVRNENWEEGQAGSLITGIKPLTPSPSPLQGEGHTGGAIFLLADQPQVTVEVIRALVEHHAGTLYPVIAPYVFERRANPVLFDRVTFEALMQLSGDQGGRGVFSQFSPRYLAWYDQRLLLDVDTPEDYERLLQA
ncbi:MAG: selenium cofactor biosynthesis protein YqeC [Chloroflexota bacterium]